MLQKLPSHGFGIQSSTHWLRKSYIGPIQTSCLGNNAIQRDHCVLETAVRKPLCYDTMIQKNDVELRFVGTKTMDSWIDGYWFLIIVPEYWFPGIGSRVPYTVTQNAGTIHSSPRKPCQNEEIQVWHKKCTECIQMIVFHDSFGEPSKPPNHASNDPKYYTTSDWLSPEIKLIMPYRGTTVFWKPP